MPKRTFMAPPDADRCEHDRRPLWDRSGARCMHRKAPGSRFCVQHTPKKNPSVNLLDSESGRRFAEAAFAAGIVKVAK